MIGEVCWTVWFYFFGLYFGFNFENSACFIKSGIKLATFQPILSNFARSTGLKPAKNIRQLESWLLYFSFPLDCSESQINLLFDDSNGYFIKLNSLFMIYFTKLWTYFSVRLDLRHKMSKLFGRTLPCERHFGFRFSTFFSSFSLKFFWSWNKCFIMRRFLNSSMWV